MLAIVQGPYGPPSALVLADLAAPRVGDRDVLVEVRAAAVTQADRRLRSGDFPGIAWLPGRLAMGLTGPRHRPGSTFAGRVAAVGSAVADFAVGDDVFGSALERGGTYAEQVAIPADGRIARMPAGLDYADACALPYGAVTALIYLRDLAAVRPGERVCVLGAAGGVGALAVQVARHLGAEVTAVCSARSDARVRSLGADHVVDYRAGDFRSGRYDVVLDTVGASSLADCRRALEPGGRYLSLVVSGRLVVDMLVTSVVGGQRALGSVATGERQHLEDVRALVEQGALRPVVGRVFPLAHVADAHAHLESGQADGTVVVTIPG